MNTFDVLTLPDGTGHLLLSAFPDRPAHLDGLAAAGAAVLLSLTPAEEMTWLGLPPAVLAARCRERGLDWRHIPVADMGVAGSLARTAWSATSPLLHGLLDAGRGVALHCRMGLGRTGTMAAVLLVERGMAPDAAVTAVRAARPGSIETLSQERLVADWRGRRPLGS